MKIEKPSIVLAYTGWVSVFIEIWLLILRLIPADRLSLVFLIFFFFIALMASGVYAGKPKSQTTDIRVRIGDQVFSEEAGNLAVTKNGAVALCVIKPMAAYEAAAPMIAKRQ